MIIKTLKINKKILITFITIFVTLIIISSFIIISNSIQTSSLMYWNNATIDLKLDENGNYIKWVDFKVTSEAMKKTAKLDIDSHKSNSEIKYNWIELLAYLACKNGGNFKKFKQNDLDDLVDQLKKRKNYGVNYRKFKTL